MALTQIRYIGECKCLNNPFGDVESSLCLKRYITVDDIYFNETYCLAVCSEWFRLKHTQLTVEKNSYKYQILRSSWHYARYSSDRSIRDKLIEDIILSSTNYDSLGYCFTEGFSKFNTDVNFPICERPYITAIIPLTEALDIIADEKSHFRHLLSKHTARILIINIDKVLEYAKYKSHHVVAKRLKKRISNCYEFYWKSDELLSEINDFMIKILKQYNKS